ANNACVDDAIQFNDLSTIPNNTNGGIINKWLWDLDDKDLLSSVQNPVYTYETAGIYDVSLTVTTDQGCVSTVIKPVTAGPPPVPNFKWSGICNSQSTLFTDQSTIPGG